MSFRFRFLLIVLLLSLAIFLPGCGTQTPLSSSREITVSTSISPLADLIRQVGGDKVKVTNLVPAGLDPHEYEPRPEDVRQVALSKVFFANGVGEELYLNKLIQNAGNPQLRSVILSDGLPVLQRESGGPGNPHLWLDVMNAEHYVKAIRDILAEVSPTNKAYFEQNAADYLRQLDELDQWITSQIATIPPEARQIIVFHDALPYYAKRYGLTILRPVIHNGEAEPSAKDYSELVQLIREHHVRAVFGEAGFNPKLVQQLAQDAGVKYVGNLYDDTLGTTPDNDSYLAMMRSDTKAIVQALR
ncbi:MAG: metal ABC transporter substrate-binding protein [Desulfitobacteriaceae bacterium]